MWISWASAAALASQQPATPTLTTPPIAVTAPIETAPTAVSPISTKHPSTGTLPIGQPLRVQVDHRYRMKVGAPVAGYLIDPVYSTDHVLLPVHTRVSGTIVRLLPVSKSDRTWALLGGDFTPLKMPVLAFDTMTLSDGTRVSLSSRAIERTTGVVRMATPKKKSSHWQQFRATVHAKFESTKHALNVHQHHHKAEWALRLVYSQMLYHPQDIWFGTQFDAELTAPLTVPDLKAAAPLPITPPNGHIPAGTIEARLTTGISSATSKQGTSVEAVLTQPYMDASRQHVLLPTGTRLVGNVTQAKPARKFGKNGTLRFTFKQVQLPAGTMERVNSQMTAVEGQKGQNIKVDSEGGAQANSGKGKFLAPLAMGMLAANSLDADQNFIHAGVASNGFGLVANIVGLALVNPNITAGFAYYAMGKTITRRWILPGHNVVFPKNTRMEMNIADR